MRNCFYRASVLLLAGAGAVVSFAGDGAVSATAVVRADPDSGRLVRKIEVPPESRNPATIRRQAGIDQLVEESAARHGVDPLLVHSVIQAESDYNPFAVSRSGAQGLMQLIPDTARRFDVTNSFDARENIDAGVRYLKQLQDRFGDERLVLAAYNAGEGTVERHDRAVPPYPETQEFVQRVSETYSELKQQSGDASQSEAEYRPFDTFVDSEGRLVLKTR